MTCHISASGRAMPPPFPMQSASRQDTHGRSRVLAVSAGWSLAAAPRPGSHLARTSSHTVSCTTRARQRSTSQRPVDTL